MNSPCDMCGASIAGTVVSLPDGRHSCALCAQTAVNDSRTLRLIEADVRAWMSRELDMTLGLRPWATVECLGRDEIRKLARGSSVLEPAGLFSSRWEFRGQKRRPVHLRVLILSGYPARRAWAFLAHELTHLWQAETFPLHNRDPLWVEGLAVWVEREACVDLGDHAHAEGLATSQDPVYGVGYRRVRKTQGRTPRRGLPATVARLQPRGGVPAG